jgi:hypothetical protein
MRCKKHNLFTYRADSDCKIYSDSFVVIRPNELTSIIAYSLSSNEYLSLLKEINNNDFDQSMDYRIDFSGNLKLRPIIKDDSSENLIRKIKYFSNTGPGREHVKFSILCILTFRIRG